MFTASPMDRLGYLGYPNDAEVDALLSQLSDENLLKLKVNTHNTSSRGGFEYPTFTDGWLDDDATQALDTQLTSRFSSLKRPIAPAAKKKGNDSLKVGSKKGSNSDRGAVGGQKGNNNNKDSHTFGSKSSSTDSITGPEFRTGRDSNVMGWKGSDDAGQESSRRLSGKTSSRTSSRRSGEDGSSSRRQHQIKRNASRSASQRTEFYSFRSSDDPLPAAADEDDEDPNSIDALLNERFRALKATPPASSTSSSTPPSSGNLGLDNLIQISGQLSTNSYDDYGYSFSIPSSPSPSANLLGRSKSRSSPRVMTNSVATSYHCSAPSPLKLLKQVGSKSFPSKQQLSPGSLPPLSPARRSSPSVKKAGKVEGFGNSKPAGKQSERNIKERKDKKERKSSNDESNNTNPSTIKDMRRLLSSVADRVGLERSRVSSAVDDEVFAGEDSSVWSVMDGEQEFSRASTEEEKLNREAERVVEWAKDAARLETGESDLDGEVDDLDLDGEDDDEDSNERKPSKKEKPKRKGVKVARKKKWGLF